MASSEVSNSQRLGSIDFYAIPNSHLVRAHSLTHLLNAQLKKPLPQPKTGPSTDLLEDKTPLIQCLAKQPSLEGYAQSLLHRFSEGTLTADQTRTELARLVFLAERAEPLAIEEIQKNHPNLKALVQKELGRIKENLETLEKKHHESAIPTDIALIISHQIPQELANCLLTSNGQLNFGLVSDLQEAFLPKNPLEWLQNLSRTLDQMDASWQEIINTIQLPKDPCCVSNDLIRAELQLPLSMPLTDLHAKQVALSAVLCQLNQGPVGDCFAVAWEIRKHNVFPLRALKDYAQLLREGFLLRPVGHEEESFFYVPTLADEALTQEISLDPQAKFWQWPTIIAACRHMGIDDPEQEAQAILRLLHAKTTPEKIIQAYAEVRGKDAARGNYGFSAINHRLLRATETAFAGMAEARTSDPVRKATIACALKALRMALKKLDTSSPIKIATLNRYLDAELADKLNRKIRYVYNAVISMSGLSADNHSTMGGFELYERADFPSVDRETRNALLRCRNPIGKKVETPPQFSNLVGCAIELTKPFSVLRASSSPEEIQFFTEVFQTISSFAKTRSFTDETFRSFAMHFETSQREMTPLSAKCGDNPREVIAIEHGADPEKKLKTARFANPYDLIQWVLDLVRWQKDTNQDFDSNLPQQLVPVESPQHAFNLSLGNKEMDEFLKSNLSSEAWLHNLLVAGEKISSARFPPKTRKMIELQLLEHVKKQWRLPPQFENQFQTLMDQSHNQHLSILYYSQQLVNTVSQFLGINPRQLGLLVDSLLIPHLPEVSAQSVRFALTNWNDSVKNIYFCIYYNPRTKELALGQINEDKTGLSPMDEDEWVNRQEWTAEVNLAS